jgi:hypothetical protein
MYLHFFKIKEPFQATRLIKTFIKKKKKKAHYIHIRVFYIGRISIKFHPKKIHIINKNILNFYTNEKRQYF